MPLTATPTPTPTRPSIPTAAAATTAMPLLQLLLRWATLPTTPRGKPEESAHPNSYSEDQGFGRSWHRSDHRIAPCVIPKGKYIVTGPTWRLMDKQAGLAWEDLRGFLASGTKRHERSVLRRNAFCRVLGPEEISAYRMEELLTETQLNDMATRLFSSILFFSVVFLGSCLNSTRYLARRSIYLSGY